MQDRKIRNVEVGDDCLESYPCQHGIKITYEDGGEESKLASEPTIASKYARYLKPHQRGHFNVAADDTDEAPVLVRAVPDRYVDNSLFAPSRAPVRNTVEENDHVRRLTNVSSESRYNQYLEHFSPALQKYIEAIRNKKTYTTAIKELKITLNEAELFNNFLDPVKKHVMNVPVRFDGVVYDLDTLVNGKSTGELFNIQPARDVANMIEDMIETLKSSRTPHPSC